MINTSRISMEKLVRDSSRFSEFDALRIKSMLNTDFPNIQVKVENLAQEVFDEVVQHEMALAGLSDVNLETVFPPPDTATGCVKTRKSLLLKMASLQAGIRMKKISGTFPKLSLPIQTGPTTLLPEPISSLEDKQLPNVVSASSASSQPSLAQEEEEKVESEDAPSASTTHNLADAVIKEDEKEIPPSTISPP